MIKAVRWFAAFIARWMPAGLRTAFYKIPGLAHLIRNVLNRAAPSGITKVQIAAGYLKDSWMFLDLHKEKDYWLGTYEINLSEAIAHFIQPGMVVYDVGANIGYISLVLSRCALPNGHVFAFEALPENIERLQQNIRVNQLDERVTVISAAVAASSEPVCFLVHNSTSMGKMAGSAGRNDQVYRGEITVPGIALDDFVFQKVNPPPDVIKMDIEGGEVMAIDGMVQVLKCYHPLMLIELHGHEAAKKVGSTLLELGYHLHRMQKGYPKVETLEDLDWKSYMIGMWDSNK